jgi:hypothetical protein
VERSGAPGLEGAGAGTREGDALLQRAHKNQYVPVGPVVREVTAGDGTLRTMPADPEPVRPAAGTPG